MTVSIHRRVKVDIWTECVDSMLYARFVYVELKLSSWFCKRIGIVNQYTHTHIRTYKTRISIASSGEGVSGGKSESVTNDELVVFIHPADSENQPFLLINTTSSGSGEAGEDSVAVSEGLLDRLELMSRLFLVTVTLVEDGVQTFFRQPVLTHTRSDDAGMYGCIRLPVNIQTLHLM